MMLFKKDVEAACKKHFEEHKNNCSGFVRAVADELIILVPGISSNANGQIDWMRLINTRNTAQNNNIFRQIFTGNMNRLSI